MHPALRSWRNDLPPNIVRLLAYLGAIALLSIVSAYFSKSLKVMGVITPMHQPGCIDIERPLPPSRCPSPKPPMCRQAIRSDSTQ